MTRLGLCWFLLLTFSVTHCLQWRGADWKLKSANGSAETAICALGAQPVSLVRLKATDSFGNLSVLEENFHSPRPLAILALQTAAGAPVHFWVACAYQPIASRPPPFV